MGNTIFIDRSNPFDPINFIGIDWNIIEEDKRSLALSEVDLSQVRFETMLRSCEIKITGEEKLKRLKASRNIRLDAKIFQTLWENQHCIPQSWKEKVNGNIRYIFFDGTVIRNRHCVHCVLCLYWDGGRWYREHHWLGRDRHAPSSSAVLAN